MYLDPEIPSQTHPKYSKSTSMTTPINTYTEAIAQHIST